jgi:hypothetical protein
MIPSPFAPVQHGKQLSLSQIERIGHSLSALHEMSGAGNLQFETGASGHTLVDQTLKPVLVIVGAQGGSGSGGAAGTGSGNAGTPIPANDQFNAYEGNEAAWTVVNDDFVVVEKQNGMRFTLTGIPLIEANQVEDVPSGAVVWAFPCSALGYRFYFFFWAGDLGSGSGGSSTVTCSDGTVYPVTINGTSIVVGDPL